jgi:AcrR family transcriptional regulator
MDKQIESPVGKAEPVLGVRAAGKARSRRNLIEAGRRLFMERGYEGATVRDIAAAAGLSTGAVFASFADKAELFNEVLLADSEAQTAEMMKAAAAPGPVRERLVRVLAVSYEFQLQQIQLLRAALAVSWSQGLGGEIGDRPVRKAATETISGMLVQAMAAGELKPGCDVDIVTDTIWDCFIGNYRYALFNDQGVEMLTERMRRQIDLIMTGIAA